MLQMKSTQENITTTEKILHEKYLVTTLDIEFQTAFES
jgi:hypothetical protein